MAEKTKKSFSEKDKDRIILIVAVAGLCAILYLLFFYSPLDWIINAKSVASIKTEGTVRRRHAGNLAWRNIKGQDSIYLRDVVYVPKNTEAFVTLPGKGTFPLPPDTMVQFDETSLDEIAITLREGTKPKFQLMPSKLHMAKLTRYLQDVMQFELRLSELRQRTLDKVFKELPLVRTSPIFKNDFALDLLDDYDLKLVSPKSDRYNLKSNRWMKMSWSAIPLAGVNYTLEISKDSIFSRVLPHSTKSNRLLIQFDDEGTYYWRVRAEKDRRTLVSDSWNFTMLHRGGQASRTLAFKLPTGGPKGYPFEVSKTDQFDDVVKNGLGDTAECKTQGLAPGKYYCRVRAPKGTEILKIYELQVP